MSWRSRLGAAAAAMVFAFHLGLGTLGGGSSALGSDGNGEGGSTGVLGKIQNLPLANQLVLQNLEETKHPVQVEITDLTPRVLEKQDKLVVRGSFCLNHDAPVVNLIVRMRAQSALNAQQLQDFLDGNAFAGQWVASQVVENVKAGVLRQFAIEIPRANLPLGSEWEWGPRGLEVVAETSTSFSADRTLLLWDSGVKVEPTRLHAIAPLISPVEFNSLDKTSGDDSGKVNVKELLTTPIMSLVSPTEKTWPLATEVAKIRGVSLAAPVNQLRSDYAQHALSSAASEIIAVPDDYPDIAVVSQLESANNLVKNFKSQLQETNFGKLKVRTDVVLPTLPTNADSSLTAPAPQLVDAGVLSQWPTSLVVSGDLPLAQPFDYTYQPGAKSFYKPTGELSATPISGGGTLLASTQSFNQVFKRVPQTVGQQLDDEQLLRALSAVITRERPFESREFLTLLPLRAFDTVQVGRLHALLENRWVRTSSKFYEADAPQKPVALRVFPSEKQLENTALTAEVKQLSAASAESAAIATALGIEKPVAKWELAVTQQLLSVYLRELPESRQQLVETYQRQLRTLKKAIRVVQPATINLLDRNAKLPLRVVNDADFPTTVVVEVLPSDPRLQVPESLQVSLPARGERKLEFPVTAVGSGDLDVRVVVRTTDLALINQDTQFPMRVRADWESTGTLVVVITLVILVLVGAVRTMRKGRRMSKIDEGGK